LTSFYYFTINRKVRIRFRFYKRHNEQRQKQLRKITLTIVSLIASQEEASLINSSSIPEPSLALAYWNILIEFFIAKVLPSSKLTCSYAYISLLFPHKATITLGSAFSSKSLISSSKHSNERLEVIS
jgi:hypothetical protein